MMFLNAFDFLALVSLDCQSETHDICSDLAVMLSNASASLFREREIYLGEEIPAGLFIFFS